MILPLFQSHAVAAGAPKPRLPFEEWAEAVMATGGEKPISEGRGWVIKPEGLWLEVYRDEPDPKMAAISFIARSFRKRYEEREKAGVPHVPPAVREPWTRDRLGRSADCNLTFVPGWLVHDVVAKLEQISIYITQTTGTPPEHLHGFHPHGGVKAALSLKHYLVAYTYRAHRSGEAMSKGYKKADPRRRDGDLDVLAAASRFPVGDDPDPVIERLIEQVFAFEAVLMATRQKSKWRKKFPLLALMESAASRSA